MGGRSQQGLLEEHEHLSQEARVQVAKLELMRIVDWEQEVGGVLRPLPSMAPRPTIWRGEPERRGSPLDPPVEPPNLTRVFQIPEVIRGWGHNSNNRNLRPGIISMRKMTPLMMILGRTRRRC